MSAHTIKLTWFEFLAAGNLGVNRRALSIRDKRKHRSVATSTNMWIENIEGAAGEIAFCKFMDWYFSMSVDTFRITADVKNVEVKTRIASLHKRGCAPDKIEMFVKEKEIADSPSRIFALVVSDATATEIPVYHMVGWIEGAKAKEVGRFDNLGHADYLGAYFVSQHKLTPFTDDPARGIPTGVAEFTA